MSGVTFRVMFQPALAEEAVLRALNGHPDERAFRRERDRLYREPDAERRDLAFEEFHLSWFARLELGAPVDAALAEFPTLAEACARCVVTRAPTRREEGADLLVADMPDGSKECTVSIRLRPAAFETPPALLDLLRFELLHVADMVDPAFGYDPNLPPADGGPTHAQLIRERYRVVWDVTVAGRLEERGLAAEGRRAEVFQGFSGTFPMLGDSTSSAFARFFTGAHSHDEIMGFAVAPLGAGKAERLVPGGRCPLCRFPTYAPEPNPDSLSPDAVRDIMGDFPDWEPARGLCCQCAEIYRTRSLVNVPANMLRTY